MYLQSARCIGYQQYMSMNLVCEQSTITKLRSRASSALIKAGKGISPLSER